MKLSESAVSLIFCRAPPVIEWELLFTLASDWLGFLHKDSVRGIYDGSVFTKLEKKWHPSQSDI